MIFKKLFTAAILVAFLAIWVVSCKDSAQAESQETTSTSTPIDDSQRILDKETFAAEMKKSGAVIVDVRTPGEFDQGHIEDAININFFDPEFRYKLLELNKKKKYYLYCKNEVRSYRAMKFMEDNDFDHVYILKEGYKGWNTATAE
jgi:rhodanese-related sulfurtransferase